MLRRSKPLSFDRTRCEPCLRKSICTGERTAGFRDRETGRFTGYAVIRSDAELDAFLRAYGIDRSELRILY